MGLSLPHSTYVGFGTLRSRLPWFHWAVPSTTLDKVFILWDLQIFIISLSFRFVNLLNEKMDFLPNVGLKGRIWEKKRLIRAVPG